MAPKAILFDVFGTIVDWRGSLIAELSAWGEARKMQADWTGLVDAWRGAYQPSMERVRLAQMPWTPIDALHRMSLNELAPRFGVSGLGEAEMDWINRGWHRLRPWPDAVPGLQRLRERCIVGTLSNGNVALLVNMAKNAGLPWDIVLSAELFGYYKPDQKVYRGACRVLALQPHEVMLAAAHNFDLKAAKGLGLRTAFIRRPTEYGPDQATDLEAEGEWDLQVSGVDELAERLEG